jgi:Glycosyl hydrolase family 76
MIASVGTAAQKAATNLINYYSPNPYGAIPQNGAEDETGVQWYDVGIMWGDLFEYCRVAKDGTMVPTITGALVNASYGPVASFLGGSQGSALAGLFGKWNDDILWWAMPGTLFSFEGIPSDKASQIHDV